MQTRPQFMSACRTSFRKRRAIVCKSEGGQSISTSVSVVLGIRQDVKTYSQFTHSCVAYLLLSLLFKWKASLWLLRKYHTHTHTHTHLRCFCAFPYSEDGRPMGNADGSIVLWMESCRNLKNWTKKSHSHKRLKQNHNACVCSLLSVMFIVGILCSFYMNRITINELSTN